MNLEGRNFLTLKDFDRHELAGILEFAHEIKQTHKSRQTYDPMRGKMMAMIFQKPSLRTRVSFETGIYQLGGIGMFFSPQDLQMGRGETIHDTAKVLSRYVDGIMARVFEHQKILDLAQYATVPVINGLSDFDHPCQALADLFTIYEKKGRLKGLTLAYVGDGNNVLHSLIQGCVKVGMNINYASPEGYTPLPSVVEEANEVAKATGSVIAHKNTAAEALENADVIYTDVWVSMGQEEDEEKKIKALEQFQLNTALMKKAKPDILVMHCLPAHRGQEITDEVMDGPNSIVFDQAENRMHTQKAIMKLLMK